MIEDAFKTISEFAFLITYNGDEFDLPYLYNRAERLGTKKEDNPLIHDARFCNSKAWSTS